MDFVKAQKQDMIGCTGRGEDHGKDGEQEHHAESNSLRCQHRERGLQIVATLRENALAQDQPHNGNSTDKQDWEHSCGHKATMEVAVKDAIQRKN